MGALRGVGGVDVRGVRRRHRQRATRRGGDDAAVAARHGVHRAAPRQAANHGLSGGEDQAHRRGRLPESRFQQHGQQPERFGVTGPPCCPWSPATFFHSDFLGERNKDANGKLNQVREPI
jgi:hypothetical protein